MTLKRDKSVLTRRNWIFRTRRFTKGHLPRYVRYDYLEIPENVVVICVE